MASRKHHSATKLTSSQAMHISTALLLLFLILSSLFLISLIIFLCAGHPNSGKPRKREQGSGAGGGCGAACGGCGGGC
ncbi:hypothetical protein GOBAR_AA13864 [Gossypium barbadense]|uniref:Uncharacterized protein n=3 Tax=Gossypium TaxID=3633 RepID=A0A2P5XTV9_GOSBA|nr:hypothetical protein GOBAR_AA13864 [Gossypium barbadense]TYG94925.1 hypothetical protein ES288_A11G226700v1 [Gossypium darwinii]TYI01805.1 hypothetical protein ES332_A11G225700v1 [Gossypium tomentosum]